MVGVATTVVETAERGELLTGAAEVVTLSGELPLCLREGSHAVITTRIPTATNAVRRTSSV
jgi:hypothetical protein